MRISIIFTFLNFIIFQNIFSQTRNATETENTEISKVVHSVCLSVLNNKTYKINENVISWLKYDIAFFNNELIIDTSSKNIYPDTLISGEDCKLIRKQVVSKNSYQKWNKIVLNGERLKIIENRFETKKIKGVNEKMKLGNAKKHTLSFSYPIFLSDSSKVVLKYCLYKKNKHRKDPIRFAILKKTNNLWTVSADLSCNDFSKYTKK